MLRRFGVGVVFILVAEAWGLDDASQKLADRYVAILSANPSQTVAFDRLWKIYADAGETSQLFEQARAWARERPALAARLLQKGGQVAEARAILEPRVREEAASAELLAHWIEEAEGPAKAATALESWGLSDPSLFILQGELWSRAGRADQAQGAWRQALALAPHDRALRQRLARAALAAGDLDEALAQWQVIATEGTPTEKLAALEEIASRGRAAQRWDAAIEAQEKVLAMLGPGHWKRNEVQAALIGTYAQAGRSPELEARWIKEAEEADPVAVQRLVDFYTARPDEEARLRWQRRAVDLSPRDPALLRTLAQSELAAGNLAEASAGAERLEALQPGDVDTIFLRAEVAALGGKDELAASLIEKIAGPGADEALQLRAQDFYGRLRLTGPQERNLQGAVGRAPSSSDDVLALARFYLRQKRFAEAEAALERFPLGQLSSSEGAEVAWRFAEFLREANLDEGALKWAQRAWGLKPSVPAALMSAELLDTSHQRAKALAMVIQACDLDGLPDEATDRRLFTALRTYQSDEDLLKGGPNEVSALIGRLQKRAFGGETDEAWVRLVRWRRWNNEKIAAEESGKAGLQRFPESRSLQNALAEIFLADGNTDEGIAALERLAVLDPAQAREIHRRIGHLELDRTRPEEAEKIFRALLQEQPDDWAAVADIAITQQAAGNWFEALESWRKAWQLAPPSNRRTLRSSILGAVTRLQLPTHGLEFLETAVEQERDPAARSELLHEAAVFAREQKVEDAWRAVLEKHIREKGAPAYWREGLAWTWRERGSYAEARDALATESNQADNREFLLKTAEQEGNLVEAARLAGLLARQEQAASSEAWLRYAGLQERAGLFDEATATWKTLAVRFARDPQVLLAAADYAQRRGDRERGEMIRRAAARLETPSPSVLWRLGRVALARLDRDQAVQDFEQILTSTQPDAAAYENGLPWPLPQNPTPGAVLARDPGLRGAGRNSEWVIPSESEVEGCRLLAIKELGRLLANSPRKAAWLAGFSHPAEKLWAEYYTGNIDGALELALKMKPVPEEAFAVLALQAGKSGALADWASEKPERWDAAMVGLAFLLDQAWQPKQETLAALLQNAPPIRRWGVAQQLAAHHYHRLASQLAEGAPAEFPQPQMTPAYLEMAEWQVALRDPARALEMLDLALAHSTPTPAYAKPYFSALHARWLLTPEAERAAFRQATLDRVGQSKNTASIEATRAFLAALSGNHESAQASLELAFPPSSSALGREWFDLIQQGGAQLEQWKLHRLARDLYRIALKRDRALLSLRDESFQRLSESSLLQSSLFTASPEFARYLVAEWRARGVAPEELLQAARRLLAMGQERKGTEIIKLLCREDPRSDAMVMGIFSLTPQRALAGDLQGYIERVLGRPGAAPLSKSLAVQAGLRLASTARQNGDYAVELKILEKLQGDPASAPSVVLSRSQALCRLGRPREAVELLEKAAQAGDPAPYAFALAELYSALGRETEALALLRKQLKATPPFRSAAATRLQELAIVTGDADALAAAGEVLADSPTARRLPDDPAWPRVVAELDQQYPKPSERFAAGAQLLLGQSHMPPAVREQEVRRLEGLAQDEPDLQSRYFVFRTSLARQTNTLAAWEKELLPQWKDGSYFAGEILIQLYLEQGRKADLEAVLDRYLTEPYLREVAWLQLARDLIQCGENQLAERVLRSLASFRDGDAERDLLLAEAVGAQGRPTAEIVGPVEKLVKIDPGLHLPLARYYLARHQVDEAKVHLAEIPPVDNLDTEAAAAWGEMASQLITAGRLDEAQAALAEAIHRDFSAVSSELVASYYTARVLAPLDNAFQLPQADWRKVQTVLLEKLHASGNEAEVLALFEKDPALLNAAEHRAVLQKAESADWSRAAAIWAMIEDQAMLWEVQAEAAQFHARRAASLSQDDPLYGKELARANQLDPGNFRLASALVDDLIRRGRPAQATKVLELAIRSFGSTQDRKDARRMLEGMQLTPPLPKEG